MTKAKNRAPLYETYHRANANANPYRFATTIASYKENHQAK